MEKKQQPLKTKQPARKRAIQPEAVALKPSQAKVAEAEAAFPIVGIGASAGGLAAIEKFFAGMPADRDSGMAFVVVQHLAPDHKSILDDLIRRYTRMKVYEVKDGIEVLPNCAYIIPPNRDMAFLHGNLYLSEPMSPRGLRLPIDFFFRSLAQDQHERAICIVLSGTGTDGTLGLRAIKGEGGMAMAQTPESTEYDGMPRSAISTGLVDYVLPPGEMGAQLIAYAKHLFSRKPRQISPTTPQSPDLLKKVHILLRAKTGHDFSFYKQNTIMRRIERRMAVNQVERLEDYLRHLQQSPTEVEALFRDLLIGVTSFFRDPDAFKVLQELAVPRLFDKITSAGPVRVWVPGCSTGEEAYSIAILLHECMETRSHTSLFQIFATDIDSQAISTARAGIYPASVAADISPERLARFFTLSDDGSTYHVQQLIRDMLIFSEQDVTLDPPFSRLGLVSCRNLLIYMGAELQKKVLATFQYALKQDGFLFLGSAESIGELTDAFQTVDRMWKLYQHKGAAHLPPAPRGIAPLLPVDARPPRLTVPWESRSGIRESVERALLQQYAPASVVINERGEILFIHGSTGKYLEPAAGEASVNIMRMAREGLRRELTNAIRRVAARQEPVNYQGLRVKSNGETITVNLTVRPFEEDPAFAQGLLLAIFEEAPSKARGVAGAEEAAVASPAGEERIKALEQELQDKEEYLQSTFQELDTSNEELKSTNEELQSANEELGATNEELETSREELQSINEELLTVNTELQMKLDQLCQSNNNMENLLTSTNIGTIFVDTQMCLTFFTPAVNRVVHIRQSDIGRPITHVVMNLEGYDRLAEDIQAVLNSLVPFELEVHSKENLWYLMRILPFRTLENTIEGAVVTFIDITRRKKIEEELYQSEARHRLQAEDALKEANLLRRLAVVVCDSSDAVAVQDLQGRILAWNPGAVRMYGWSESEALAMNMRKRVPGGKVKGEVAMLKKIALGEKIEPFQTVRLAKDGNSVKVWLTASALIDEKGKLYAISTTERAVA